MERTSLDFRENYSETMLFFKHTVKQCLVSIISQIQKGEQVREKNIIKCPLKNGIDPSSLRTLIKLRSRTFIVVCVNRKRRQDPDVPMVPLPAAATGFANNETYDESAGRVNPVSAELYNDVRHPTAVQHQPFSGHQNNRLPAVPPSYPVQRPNPPTHIIYDRSRSSLIPD